MSKNDRNLAALDKAYLKAMEQNWAEGLLDEMADRRVEITRTQTKKLWRAVFGAAGLRDLPTGAGRVIRRLPNGIDALVLDYADRARRFEPCWVTGRVHRGAVQIVLPSEGLGSRLLRALRISTRRGLSHAA